MTFTDIMFKGLPWLLSGTIIIYIYLVGKKKVSGWWLCLANQAIFTYWNCLAKSWGFIPVNIVVAILCVKHIVEWSKKADHE